MVRLIAFALALAVTPAAAAPLVEIVVEAGAHDRENTPVRFPLPAGIDGKSLVLRDGRGRPVPVQPDDRGHAVLLLPSLKRGAKLSLFLEARDPAPPARGGVMAIVEKEGIDLRIDGRPVLRFQTAARLPRPEIGPEYLRAGYIHPVFTPAGVMVTDDYPPNHLHHHGIWSSWSETEFEGRRPDFWNMGKKTGLTTLESAGPTWSGPVHGGFRARLSYVDRTGKEGAIPVAEQWRVTVYRTHQGPTPYFLFDLESSQQGVAGRTLKLRQHRYGGVGLRGHREWNGKDAAAFLTAEGKNRVEGDAKPGRWVHLGGKVGGRAAGIAVLGHPGNFRAPQPMRLHPDEPFFNFAPTQAGPFEIRPDRPYEARYRFVVADGPPDPKLLERLYRDFAEPPAVVTKAAGR